MIRKGENCDKKANKTFKDKVRYAKLSKLMKKKPRTRARRKKKRIQETLEARKGPRQT